VHVTAPSTRWKGDTLARSFYNYEKRRKELAKKKKKEDKRQRKLEKKNAQSTDSPEASPDRAD
jgi:hypothetical protein